MQGLLLFAGPLNQNVSTNYTTVYSIAFVLAIITTFFIYKTRTIPYQLTNRKRMLAARYLAPVVGILLGVYGFAYNDQTTYLITVPIYSTIVLEILVSLWIWHEVCIITGKHKKFFSQQVNKILVILCSVALVGLCIVQSTKFVNTKESQRKNAQAFCESDLENLAAKKPLTSQMVYDYVENTCRKGAKVDAEFVQRLVGASETEQKERDTGRSMTTAKDLMNLYQNKTDTVWPLLDSEALPSGVSLRAAVAELTKSPSIVTLPWRYEYNSTSGTGVITLACAAPNHPDLLPSGFSASEWTRSNLILPAKNFESATFYQRNNQKLWDITAPGVYRDPGKTRCTLYDNAGIITKDQGDAMVRAAKYTSNTYTAVVSVTPAPIEIVEK